MKKKYLNALIYQKFGFTKRVDKGLITTVKDLESSEDRSDEGLTLETSAFYIFHGGDLTLIKAFDKTQLLFHSFTNAAPQFLSKLEIHALIYQSAGCGTVPGSRYVRPSLLKITLSNEAFPSRSCLCT